MKYLKTYEKKYLEKPWNYLEGYYVVLDYTNYLDVKYKFIENKIGKIEKALYPGSWIKVSYDDFGELEKSFHVSDIAYASPDKKKCEAFLKAKKFNL